MVCQTCAEGDALAQALRAGLHNVDVEEVACMSGCMRAQTVAFRETGKVAYLFGDITIEDMSDLQTFVDHYAASSDGVFDDARVLGGLRHKAIARIPG